MLLCVCTSMFYSSWEYCPKFLAGLLAFPRSVRLPDSSVAFDELTLIRGDYSCRYSSGFAPDSLASICSITNFGGKDNKNN